MLSEKKLNEMMLKIGLLCLVIGGGAYFIFEGLPSLGSTPIGILLAVGCFVGFIGLIITPIFAAFYIAALLLVPCKD